MQYGRTTTAVTLIRLRRNRKLLKEAFRKDKTKKGNILKNLPVFLTAVPPSQSRVFGGEKQFSEPFKISHIIRYNTIVGLCYIVIAKRDTITGDLDTGRKNGLM